MGKIPDGWRQYTECGKPIENVPVVAFKTPLTNEFSPSDVCAYIASTYPGYEISVVVDLTNTLKYYNGVEEFGNQLNVRYEKTKCEGKSLPNDDVMTKVANIVSEVIYQHGRNSKKVVGIHCTHGVNRTGYLIARYMIEWLGYEPHNAIEIVNAARGHPIEPQKYLQDLTGRTPQMHFDEWREERSRVE